MGIGSHWVEEIISSPSIRTCSRTVTDLGITNEDFVRWKLLYENTLLEFTVKYDDLANGLFVNWREVRRVMNRSSDRKETI